MVRAGAVGTHLPASSLDIFGDLRKMNKRQLYYQVLNFAMIVSSALMIWKGLIVLTGSESPIVVVLRFLPYVGMVTIIMNDYPKFKYALLAVMGAYVLLKRES
ncbi:signal peptidase complex catalytic subunit SEC11C isoform X3 [Castor canadensis]|uniref:Signal peptidase complex catalytic subunit SEC11C isoform X3 n=2 Tax=Castor canadensis TaxID=51338 RepID=A0AC58M8S4_CASCN